jgi:nucleoid-associated protein EbfC
MFDSLKNLGALAGLMKDRERLREAGERVRARLAQARSPGEAGSGAVRVVVSGELRVLEVTVNPAFLAGGGPGDAALAGQLIAEAMNQAIAHAKDTARDAVAQEAKAMGLGDLARSLEGLVP